MKTALFALLPVLLAFFPLHAPGESRGRVLPFPVSDPPAAEAFTPANCPFENESPYTVECGYLSMPEDHANPNGKKIRLAVAIVRSPNTTQKAVPVLHLQGGPDGQYLVYATRFLKNATFSGILLEHDVILVDYRGTGYSEPAITCEVFQTPKEILTLTPTELTERVNTCPSQLAARGIDWRFYTTDQSAADLAQIGPALGYAQVNLYGVSYGTLPGLLILRDHPEIVRSAVFDSVLPPGRSIIEESAYWSEYSFSRLEAHCNTDWLCRMAYPHLREQMTSTYQRLQANPVTIDVDGEAVTITARYFAQHAAWVGERYISEIPVFITALANQDYEIAKPFLRALLKAKSFEIPNLAIYESMSCAYQAKSTSAEEIRRAFSPFSEPFQVSRFTVEDWRRCLAWSDQPTVSYALPRNDVPILLMSGEYDSTTPPAWARYAAQGLSRAQVLEIPHAGHSVTNTSGEIEICTAQMAVDFITDPLGTLDTACLEKIPAQIFTLQTTVTRLPVKIALFPLALIAVVGLGQSMNAWRKHPRWLAWGAAFRRQGIMPFLALAAITGLCLLSDQLALRVGGSHSAGDWFRTGIVATIAPLLMALQAVTLFSVEDEPALEVTLAAPRPLSWLLVERFAAITLTYILITLPGAFILYWKQSGVVPSPLPIFFFGWLAPALFLSSLGLVIAVRTRLAAFGAVTVLMLWVTFGLFAPFLLPGLAVPFPLNLIQPFLWAVNVHLIPQDLSLFDFVLNRLLLFCAGLSLLLLAVYSLRDDESILLNSQRRRVGQKAGPSQQPTNRPAGSVSVQPVQPGARAQILGMAKYEFLMLWRQRGMRVFALTPVVLFLTLAALNILDRLIDPAILVFLPRDQVTIIYGEFLVWLASIFILALVLWLYPLLVASQVPADERTGVSEWLHALPVGDSVYLAGKILGATLSGCSALTLALAAYAIIWFLRVGAFDPIPLVNLLSFCLLLLPLTTSLGVLLGATQNSMARGLMMAAAFLVVPEFLQMLPLVRQILPGNADFLIRFMATSYLAMTQLPPPQPRFEPLPDISAFPYAILAFKTSLLALLIWTWRKLRKV